MKHHEYLLRRKIVNYVGWVGYGNLGDELLMELIKREIESTFPVYYLTYLNKAYKLREYIPGFRQSVILGGGTLVFKESFYRRLVETQPDPLHLVGTGVCDVKFWCDYLQNDTVRKELVRNWVQLLNNAASISVRGDLSRLNLREHGVVSDISVIGDPVFLAYDHAQVREPDGATIGVNFGLTKDLLWGRSDKKVAQEFVKFVRHLIRQGFQIIVYCVSEADYHYVRLVLKEQLELFSNLKVRVFSKYLDYIHHVAGCSVFIGEKLHAVALALCAGVPSIMVAYRPKCEDLMSSIGMEHLIVKTDELDAERLRSLLDEVDANLHKYRNLIRDESNRLCMLQKNHIRNVVERICQE